MKCTNKLFNYQITWEPGSNSPNASKPAIFLNFELNNTEIHTFVLNNTEIHTFVLNNTEIHTFVLNNTEIHTFVLNSTEIHTCT